MLTFNTDGMVQQEFPFPAPIMDYIFKNLTAPQLLKLYQTCKFFYDKFRLNIIEDFEISGFKRFERLTGNSLAIYHRNSAFAKLKNLWISNSFTFIDSFGKHDELDFEKFSRLTYDKLSMLGPYPLREFEFLVQPPSLRHLIFGGKLYRSTKTDCLSIEDLIESVPHVSSIDLSLETKDTPLDMTKLLLLNRDTKLTSFHLNKISQIPDPILVVEFFKKHSTPDIDYYFGFTYNNDAYDIKSFYNNIDTELQAWKSSTQIPTTISSFDLIGKTVVITGAAEDIGRATVILFRKLGASVIAVARKEFQLKTLIEECQNISTPGFLHTISLDTNKGYNTGKLFERINYKFGTQFDVLVNIVDTSGWCSIPNIKLEDGYYHDVCYILECHYNLIVEAASYLNRSKGCIINVSKPDGLITKPEKAESIVNLKNNINFFETKLASSGVRINTVNPGALSTAYTRPYGITDAEFKKYLQKSKKICEKQAANAIAFLASDAAKFIVGSTAPMI